MRAAVVTSFDSPPTCRDFPTPTPQTPGEVLVDVIAAGLHPRVRSQADGSHYTSSAELPVVPGIDGVGRDGTVSFRIAIDKPPGQYPGNAQQAGYGEGATPSQLRDQQRHHRQRQG